MPAGRQQAGRLKTDVQAILFWIPPWNESLLFLDKNAAHLCISSSLCMRDARKFGVLGTLVKGGWDPATLGGWSPGWHQWRKKKKEKKAGPGLILIWVISSEFLDLSEPQFLLHSNGNN